MVESYLRLSEKWEKEEINPQLEAIKRRERVTLRDFHRWSDKQPPRTYEWVTNAPLREAIRYGSMWLRAFDSNGNPLKDLVAVYRPIDDPLYRRG